MNIEKKFNITINYYEMQYKDFDSIATLSEKIALIAKEKYSFHNYVINKFKQTFKHSSIINEMVKNKTYKNKQCGNCSYSIDYTDYVDTDSKFCCNHCRRP